MYNMILTFLMLPSSASDKATRSPERNCEAFKTLACTTTRRIARTPVPMAAGALRRTVNLGIDMDADVFLRMNPESRRFKLGHDSYQTDPFRSGRAGWAMLAIAAWNNRFSVGDSSPV
jgi:hypothetical protein